MASKCMTSAATNRTTSSSAEKTLAHQDLPFGVHQGNCGWLLYENRSLHALWITSSSSFVLFSLSTLVFSSTMQSKLNSRNHIFDQPTAFLTLQQVPSLLLSISKYLSRYLTFYLTFCQNHVNFYTHSSHVLQRFCNVPWTPTQLVQFIHSSTYDPTVPFLSSTALYLHASYYYGSYIIISHLVVFVYIIHKHTFK